MESKLEANSYETLDQFLHDARLIFANCRQYNDAQSNCACCALVLMTIVLTTLRATDVKNANKLESYLNEQIKVFVDP